MVELDFARTYAAPRQLVWDAWTDPDQIAVWWGPRGVSTPRESIEVDLRPGGRMSFEMVDDATGTRLPNGLKLRDLILPSLSRQRTKKDPSCFSTMYATVTS